LEGWETQLFLGNLTGFFPFSIFYLIWLIWQDLWLAYCLQISDQASSVPDLN